eukprot:Hpha_TRINITY_DN13517_c0_g1::TRINITY_DN13517_c0_g1_i1::g.111538::m.111538/K08341/GABARAP, ATG8, LC3; GABA(A) receptor-associated protein
MLRCNTFAYKKEVSLQARKADAARVGLKYPDHVPVVCERLEDSENRMPGLDKKKFLVPADMNVAQFLYVVRKRIRVRPEEAMFLFVNRTLPTTTTHVSTLHAMHADEDGFLYLNYSSENTYG